MTTQETPETQVLEKVVELNSKMDFEYYISQKEICVICFDAKWSEPFPTIEKYSAKWKDFKFLKVDIDTSEGEAIADSCNISVMPTFRAYKENKLLREWKGANEDKLKNELEVINGMK